MTQNDQGGLPPTVDEALAEGADLQRRLLATASPPDELLDEAREVMTKASNAGEYSWAPQEREELDLVVRRLARTLRRRGREVPSKYSRVQPFRGRNPSFEHMAHDEFVAAVQDRLPVVGRRLVAPTAGQQIELNDMTDAQILDCAFINWSFDGVDLSNARIVHSVFQGCSFAGVNLEAAAATTSLFNCATEDGRGTFRVNAPKANFSGSYVGSCDLRGACFEEAAFSYGYIGDAEADESTSFVRALIDLASLDRVTAPGADFSEARFVGSSIVKTDFTGANLERAVFSSAKVAGADFTKARLKDAAFRSAYFVALAKFDESGLEADLTQEDRDALSRSLEQAEDGVADPELHGENAEG